MSDTIRELRVRTVHLPMREPHRTASGTIMESPLVLTDVMTHDGVTGHSIVFTYIPAALEPTAKLIRNFEPLIQGEPLAPAELDRKLARKFRMLGPQGLVGMALAAIDMALWDAMARSRQMSLARLLGFVERPLQVYGSVGFDGETESARTAENLAVRGFRAIKAKIGYPDLKEDLAVIRAMRRAVGDEVAIMVDYNQSLTPVEAIGRLRVLDGEGLTWIEEPTLAHDYEGHAQIAQAIHTPIQCGENWWGTMDVRHGIAAGASDYLMLDVMKTGGVSGWLRATALADAANIRVSSHLWPELSAQLLCATPTAHWLEYTDWWNDAIAEPLQVVDGMAVLNGATGTGISWR